MATVAELVVKVGADVAEAEAGLRRVESAVTGFRDRLDALSDRLKDFGATISLGISAPLTALGGLAIKTAADYQRAMNIFQAVSGATAEQMAAVAEKAKELGADMSLPAVSAYDAVRAMTELAKAGLSVDNTLSAARGVLQLAAAGEMDVAQAAEIAAAALNAFKLPGEEAIRVADLLAAAANASAADVKDLADGFKMAAAVFSMTGQSVDSLVTALSLMANAGIKGSDAGTSLKQMLLSLIDPTDKAAQLMQQYGISVYDTDGRLKSLRDLVAEFSTKLADLTDQQRNAVLATIFGSDAVRAASVVLMGGAEAWDTMAQAVSRSGAASELAGARMQGLAGALEGLRSQLETVALALAEPLLGPLEAVVRAIADLVPQVLAIPEPLRNAALAFLAVAAATGPVSLALAGFAAILGALLSPLGLAMLAIAALAGAIAGLESAGVPVIGTVSSLAQALAAQLAPAAVVAGGLLAGLPEVLNTVQARLGAVANFIAGVFGPQVVNELGFIVDWWSKNLPMIQQVAAAVFTATVNIVSTRLSAIRDITTTVLNGVTALWDVFGKAIVAIVTATMEIVLAVVTTQLNLLLLAIQLTLALITGDWELAWQTLQQITTVATTAITQIIDIAARAIYTTITSTLDALVPYWRASWQSFADIVSAIWQDIVASTKAAINQIIDMINYALEKWNSIHLSIPGFDVSIPAVEVPGVGVVGGGRLSWPGIDITAPQVPLIPKLAEGGIVTRPTLALIGEAGPEAVVPLDKMPVNVIINVEGSILTERDLIELIRNEFIRIQQRNMRVF